MTSSEKVGDNCIRMGIANFEETMAAAKDDGVYSDEVSIGEFPWRLWVMRQEGNDDAEIVLCCEKDHESKMWFCDANMECELINQNEGGENHKLEPVISETSRLEPENANDSIIVQQLDETLLEDPEKGFIKNSTVIIEARITVDTTGKRFRKRVDHDFYSPSNASNGVLVVEGEKLYVCKQFLAMHSPFFDRLFFGNFKESNATETEIKDVNQSEFVTLLEMLHRVGDEISDDNVEFVLRLADRFEINTLLDEAEKYLLHLKWGIIHWKLRLSDQCNLQILQDHLLSEYTAELIRELKKSADYGLLSHETKLAIMDIYVELTTPE